jgi:hypothetical protein
LEKIINQVNDEHNVLILQTIKNQWVEFYIFQYFDWYPHVKNYYYESMSIFTEFLKLINKVLKQNNQKKWDIFLRDKKVNIGFDDFIFNFLSNEYNMNINSFVKYKIISEEKQKKYEC